MWLWSAGRQRERYHALPSRSQSVLVDHSASRGLKSQYFILFFLKHVAIVASPAALVVIKSPERSRPQFQL